MNQLAHGGTNNSFAIFAVRFQLQAKLTALFLTNPILTRPHRNFLRKKILCQQVAEFP
jgi:hypothetical protein